MKKLLLLLSVCYTLVCFSQEELPYRTIPWESFSEGNTYTPT